MLITQLKKVCGSQYLPDESRALISADGNDNYIHLAPLKIYEMIMNNDSDENKQNKILGIRY
jgi:hypothetical protein